MLSYFRRKPADGLNFEPYWDAEAEAKKAGIGMWALGDKYISPEGIEEDT
jgi:hypothetical protein